MTTDARSGEPSRDASVVYLGLLLAASGIIEALAGTRDQGVQHRSLILGGGMLSFAVGLLVATRPTAGVPAITLLLAGFFFAAGFAALAVSLLDRYPGWRWDFRGATMMAGAFEPDRLTGSAQQR